MTNMKVANYKFKIGDIVAPNKKFVKTVWPQKMKIFDIKYSTGNYGVIILNTTPGRQADIGSQFFFDFKIIEEEYIKVNKKLVYPI